MEKGECTNHHYTADVLKKTEGKDINTPHETKNLYSYPGSLKSSFLYVIIRAFLLHVVEHPNLINFNLRAKKGA